MEEVPTHVGKHARYGKISRRVSTLKQKHDYEALGDIFVQGLKGKRHKPVGSVALQESISVIEDKLISEEVEEQKMGFQFSLTTPDSHDGDPEHSPDEGNDMGGNHMMENLVSEDEESEAKVPLDSFWLQSQQDLKVPHRRAVRYITSKKEAKEDFEELIDWKRTKKLPQPSPMCTKVMMKGNIVNTNLESVETLDSVQEKERNMIRSWTSSYPVNVVQLCGLDEKIIPIISSSSSWTEFFMLYLPV